MITSFRSLEFLILKIIGKLFKVSTGIAGLVSSATSYYHGSTMSLVENHSVPLIEYHLQCNASKRHQIGNFRSYWNCFSIVPSADAYSWHAVQVCHALPNFILQLNNSVTISKPVVLRHDKSRKLIKLNA